MADDGVFRREPQQARVVLTHVRGSEQHADPSNAAGWSYESKEVEGNNPDYALTVKAASPSMTILISYKHPMLS